MPHERLSARELTVFLALARGDRIKVIALDLNLSIKTISTYKTRALEKMGMFSVDSISKYCRANGLIEPAAGAGGA